jgi:NAD(P)H dehydrogenase (quinone)
MTIAVTAVTGELGRATVQALIDLNLPEPVIGLARTPAKAADLGIEVRLGDYTRPDDLLASLQGVDTLFLIPGKDAPDARIGQHRNVIEAAQKAGVSKIVFASIQGPETGTAFSPIVQSNRQTEADIQASGMDWAIGRNGIYLEPDVAYIDTYKAAGEIANSAGAGKVGYVTRPELAIAFSQLLTNAALNGKVVNLHGLPISQAELAAYLSDAFGTKLNYRPMTSEDYLADRTAELGDFMGPIIAGIYDGIRLGAYDNTSDFAVVTGRPHQSWDAFFNDLNA